MSDIYTPTTEDVRRQYRAPAVSVDLTDPQRKGENFADYLSRVAGVDAFLHQQASYLAFDRWLAAHDAEVAAKAVEDAADEIDNADDYEPFKNRTESAPLGWTDWAIEAAIQSSGVITDRLRERAAEYRKAVQK